MLGVVGIYGVISYAVSQRTREIGIRLALGAQRGELKRMFVRHGLMLAASGMAIGLGAAVGLTRLMSSLLFGVSPLDATTYVAVPFLLVDRDDAGELPAGAAGGGIGSRGSPEGGVADARPTRGYTDLSLESQISAPERRAPAEKRPRVFHRRACRAR